MNRDKHFLKFTQKKQGTILLKSRRHFLLTGHLDELLITLFSKFYFEDNVQMFYKSCYANVEDFQVWVDPKAAPSLK